VGKTGTKGPPFRISVAVLVIGILIAIPGVLVFANGIWHTLSGPTYDVPGTTQLHLGKGTYIVFERTGGRQTYGPLTIRRNHGVTIGWNQLSVTGRGGETILVSNSLRNETIDRGSDHYTAAVEFDTPRPGTYTLRFDTTEPGNVIVGRSLGDLFGRRVPWLVGIGVGWLIALIGMIMLIVGLVRRGRATRRAQRVGGSSPTRVAAAAWFPDPDGRHRLRYWDGARWTDFTAE